MKIIVLTQEDTFFIPANIVKLRKVAEIQEIVVINSKYSLRNMSLNFVEWFGFSQSFKMGMMYLKRKLLSFLDPFFDWKLLNGEGSISSVAKRYNIPLKIISDVNSREFIEHVKLLQTDLAVSFSAPQIIKEPLLSMPKYGNINVHGSFLPEFRGTLPSFWVLQQDAEYFGATVHYMNKNIDDGKIICQESIKTENVKTMFEVMKKTKMLGGKLMVKAISLIDQGTVELKENDASKGHYFSWPTKEDVKNFKTKGYRLI